jgi:CRP-like cAMP-binding protein
MAGPPVDFLANVALFADLSKRDRKRVASAMRDHKFRPGQEIVRRGERGVGFFLIESGTALVQDGKNQIRLGPGAHFGELALVADVERTATVTAESELRCWAMNAWAFRPIVQSNASIAWKLLQTLGKQLAEARSAQAAATE